MRREELTDAAPAGWCRGRTRADEHTRSDQSRGGRRKSRVSHDTPLKWDRSLRFANRLVKPSLATLFKSREAERPPSVADRLLPRVTVAFWRKSDNDLGARLGLIASSSDELEKARS